MIQSSKYLHKWAEVVLTRLILEIVQDSTLKTFQVSSLSRKIMTKLGSPTHNSDDISDLSRDCLSILLKNPNFRNTATKECGHYFHYIPKNG